jgi:Flp pilus assembly pilin Flp
MLNNIIRKPRRAQGMTEYIIIVGLIAIFIIVAVKAFRGQVNDAFNKSEAKIKDEVITDINNG